MFSGLGSNVGVIYTIDYNLFLKNYTQAYIDDRGNLELLVYFKLIIVFSIFSNLAFSVTVYLLRIWLTGPLFFPS